MKHWLKQTIRLRLLEHANMNNTFIKICGVRDPMIAVEAVHLGAKYIGFIFHPSSIRHLVIEAAQEIAIAVKKAGGIPVAVFVDQDANSMLAICEQTGITTVQLHGKTAKKNHHCLPRNFTRIYVISCNKEGQPIEPVDMTYLDAIRDFLLFDYQHPGNGQCFNWDNFRPIDPFRFFLAGGLNKDNIQAAISKIKPTGVDISSGVEIEKGIKHLPYINEFIDTVNHTHVRSL